MDNFVSLHTHDHASFLDSLSKTEELVAKVKENGQSAVALTNHGSVATLIPFYKECKKAGIKPILGMESYLVEDCVQSKEDKQRYSYHIVLLAMNDVGFKNLMQLATASAQNFYYKPRIDFDLLEKYNEGIIVLTACMHGVIAYNLFDHLDKDDESIVKYACNIPLAEEYTERLQDIFGDRFYLEVQDGGIPEQILINSRIRDIAKKFNIQTVATIDSHYINKEDALAHSYLKSIAFGAKTNAMAESGNGFQTEEFYLKKRSDLAGADLTEEELDRTIEIAERCNVSIETGKYKLPKFDLVSTKPSIDILKEKLQEGWKNRLTPVQQVDQIYKDRLAKELKDSDTAGLADYFLIVADIVNYAKGQGWFIGDGRGSAAGSLISYLLNITTIDPIEYGLIWERFFNIGRKGSMADIDIDVEKRYRDDLILYIKERFGHDRVAQLATFNKLAARAVLKDVFKVAGIEFAEANKITDLIPLKNDDHGNITLDEALASTPALREYEEKYKSLFAIAKRLEGVYKSVGTHAAAIVISNEPFSAGTIPLCREPTGDGLMCAWDMKSVEDVGLLKIDILGLSTLEVVHRCIENIKKRHNIDIDIDHLPENDNKTWQLFEDGILEGVFQLETSLGKGWSKKLKPNSIRELADLVSLIRPGVADSGMAEEYRLVRNGDKLPHYIHPALEAIFKHTHGACLYQEQILEICKQVAGLSLIEADSIRRAIGKKIPAELKSWQDKFVQGSQLHGGLIPEEAEKIWDFIVTFAGYGFNLSHAVSYGILSFKTAWLKANYPHEFYLSNLLASKDLDEISRFISDAKVFGIEVKLPSIKVGNTDFELWADAIYYGMAYIKGVGEKSLTKIDIFKSVETWSEFLKKIPGAKLNKQTIIALICSGALDHLKQDRSKMKAEFELFNELTSNEINSFTSSGMNLVPFLKQVSDEDRITENKELFGKLPNVSRRGKIRDLLLEHKKASVVDDYLYKLGLEKHYIGIAITGHETDFYQALSSAQETCLDVTRGLLPKTQVDLCLLIEDIRTTHTKKSPPQEMAFLKGSDNTCSLDSIVLFPAIYKRYKYILEPGRIVNLNGIVSDRGGIICNKLEIIK